MVRPDQCGQDPAYLREDGDLLVLPVEDPPAGTRHLLPLVAVVLGVRGGRPRASEQSDLLAWEGHLVGTTDLYRDSCKGGEHGTRSVAETKLF